MEKVAFAQNFPKNDDLTTDIACILIYQLTIRGIADETAKYNWKEKDSEYYYY